MIIGLICLSVPFIWSFRSTLLQAGEQRIWGSHQADKTENKELKYTRIVIPKLGLDALVVDEVYESDLDKGPMRLAGTSHPGQPGNCCIAAHKEKWFRGLGKLKQNDPVILKTTERNYTYVVTQKVIVGANDTTILAGTRETTLTLITCTGRPYFGSSGRLAVRARLKSIHDK